MHANLADRLIHNGGSYGILRTEILGAAAKLPTRERI